MGIMKYSRLGDTFFEDKAKKINQALEKINAPYYQVCKKVRGSKANKDAFDISWRKRNITCDTDYPNATTTGEKVVMRQLEKHFGISLSLLNSDTPRAIKKSLDYQKAQQTIIDNKIKARQERERAAAERKALRNAPKTKTTTKTTTTKSIPSSERNDNKVNSKESAKREYEVFTDVVGNITYFYTKAINGGRRNKAKLNTLTNRVQYLSSTVPIYVKDYIKSFKAKPKYAKEDKTLITKAKELGNGLLIKQRDILAKEIKSFIETNWAISTTRTYIVYNDSITPKMAEYSITSDKKENVLVAKYKIENVIDIEQNSIWKYTFIPNIGNKKISFRDKPEFMREGFVKDVELTNSKDYDKLEDNIEAVIKAWKNQSSSPAKSTKAVEEKNEIEETMKSVSDIVQKLFLDKGYFTKWNLINFVNPITGTIKDKNNIKEVGKIKIEVGNMNDIAIKTMRNDFSVFLETRETNETFYGRKSDLKDKDWLSEFKEAINDFIKDNIDKYQFLSPAKSTKAVEEKKETTSKAKETNYDIKDIISNIEYQLDQTGYDYTTPFSASKNVTSTQAEFKINSSLTNEHFANLSLVVYDKSFKIIIRLKDKNPNSKIGDGGVKSYLVPMAEYEDSTQFEKPFKELKIELDKLSVARRKQLDIDLDEEEREDAKFQMEYGIKEDEEEEAQYTKVKATDFARKMGIEVNEMKPMNEPETKFKSKKLTSLNMLILAVENLTKAWVIQRRADLLKSFDVLEKRTPDKVFPQTTYLPITFGSNIYGLFEFSEVTKNKVDYYTMRLDGWEVLYFKRNGNMEDIGNDINDYLTLHLPKIVPANPYSSTVETSKFVKSTRGSGGEYNPETTEIIKETPPIMIDEDEAAKFDKGLDELTKLLQQAMQG